MTMLEMATKEKGAACESKRPKSREETPKEGSDSARRYRTATICDRDAQNARVFKAFPMQILQVLQTCNTFKTANICNIFQGPTKSTAQVIGKRGANEAISRFRDGFCYLKI